MFGFSSLKKVSVSKVRFAMKKFCILSPKGLKIVAKVGAYSRILIWDGSYSHSYSFYSSYFVPNDEILLHKVANESTLLPRRT